MLRAQSGAEVIVHKIFVLWLCSISTIASSAAKSICPLTGSKPPQLLSGLTQFISSAFKLGVKSWWPIRLTSIPYSSVVIGAVVFSGTAFSGIGMGVGVGAVSPAGAPEAGILIVCPA